MSLVVAGSIEQVERKYEEKTRVSKWLGRVIQGIHIVSDKNPCKEAAAYGAIAIATVVAAGIVYTSYWGAGLMWKEVIHAWENQQRTPTNLGHAAGWSVQGPLYLISMNELANSLAHESDFATLIALCQETLPNVKEENDGQQLYDAMLKQMAVQAPLCLRVKNPLLQALIAIRTFIDLPLNEDSSLEMRIDRTLQEPLEELSRSIQPSIIQKISAGYRAVGKRHGVVGQIAMTVRGVALPILFGAASVFSFWGAFLGYDDVTNHRDEASIIGHVGEWVENGLGYIYLLFKMNYWSITSEGELAIAHAICLNHFAKMKAQDAKSHDAELRLNRFLYHINLFLQKLADKPHLWKHIHEYEIKRNQILTRELHEQV